MRIFPLTLITFFCLQVQGQRVVDTIDNVMVIFTKGDSVFSPKWLAVHLNKKGNIGVRNTDSSISVYHVRTKDSVIENTATTWGLMQEKLPSQTTEQQAQQALSLIHAAGINLVRVPLFIQQMGTHRDLIDIYLKAGLNVQINWDWSNTSTPVPFPTDTASIRQKAEEFFQYYLPYKNQIPVVVVENEWDNAKYHKGTVKQCLTELAILVEVGHKYGFKVADAGFTGNSLGRWYWSQLAGDAARDWISHYYVGKDDPNYNLLLQAVAEYSEGIKNIPIDYLNVHWYNIIHCYGGFPEAAKAWLKLCGKDSLMNNEFGMRLTTKADAFTIESLLFETVQEMKDAGIKLAIAYSGINDAAKAVQLTEDMLEELK